MGVLRAYRFSLLLIASIVAGSAVGCLAPAFAGTIKPLGDLFLNLIFMVIVPLVFFSVAASIAAARTATVSKISWAMLAVFLATSVVAAVGSLFFFLVVQPAPGSGLTLPVAAAVQTPSILVQLVKTVSVPSFVELLSHKAMLPLMLFAAAVGLATRQLGDRGEPLARVLQSGSEVAIRLIDYVMLLAPVGLFAYFAATVSETGAALGNAYLQLFTAYYLFAGGYFVVAFSAYAWLAGGTGGGPALLGAHAHPLADRPGDLLEHGNGTGQPRGGAADGGLPRGEQPGDPGRRRHSQGRLGDRCGGQVPVRRQPLPP